MTPRGLKLAALRIAGTHPADRRWLLSRLPVAVRNTLQTELARLDGMAGTDAALFRDALQAAVTEKSAHPARSRFENDKRGINHLPPRLAAALRAMAKPADDAGGDDSFAARVQRTPLESFETVEE